MKNKYKRILTVLTCFAMALSVMPFASGDFDAYAAKKKVRKMTVYNDVYKKGNAVFCMAHGVYGFTGKLYKVSLKTSKSKMIAGNLIKPGGMSYKDGYVYFTEGSTDIPVSYLYRVKPGAKEKYLSTVYGSNYVLDKKKIYYTDASYNGKIKTKNRQMNLNGKGKKRLKNTTVKVTKKRTNAKGYKLVYVGVKAYEDGESYIDHYKCYLQKPNGKRIFVTNVE